MLLGLRIAVVAVLYLFLFTAFRALVAELRAPRAVAERAEPAPQPERGAAPAAVARAGPSAGAVVDDTPEVPPAPEYTRPLPEPPPAPPPGGPRISRRMTAAAGLLAVVMIGAGIAAAGGLGRDGLAPDAGGGDAGPPAVAPAPGRVTVGLAAQEDTNLRVTVDGVVEFNGVLEAGGRQQWEGSERIQVWTDKGKTLLLSVNGYDLGPYSPAMGHPDWNRIDFGFWPGWEP